MGVFMWKTVTSLLSDVNIGSNEKGTKQTGLPHKMLWSSPVCLVCNGHCTLVAFLRIGAEKFK